MTGIISFMMVGQNIFSQVLELIPSRERHPSGDIMTIAQFLVKTSKTINLEHI